MQKKELNLLIEINYSETNQKSKFRAVLIVSFPFAPVHMQLNG